MTERHPPHTWVDAPPQVPNPPFLWCLGKPCPDGKHRPDDDPEPGDRCKDCGRELTWRGPGPNDWDVVEPPPALATTLLTDAGHLCEHGTDRNCWCEHCNRADDQDEPDDGSPFRPHWPLLVSEDTKRELLAQLAEVVHTPRPDGPAGNYARGYETGMAIVMLTLGINEAGSPERASLPAPENAAAQPATPAPVVTHAELHAELAGAVACGETARPLTVVRLDDGFRGVTCPACLAALDQAGVTRHVGGGPE